MVRDDAGIFDEGTEKKCKKLKADSTPFRLRGALPPTRTSKDMQGRCVFSATVRLDDDRNILVERNKKA